MQLPESQFPANLDRSLGDREAVLEAVVEAMAEGVVVQDQNGAILACNASAERILGLTCDQMKGLTSMDPNWRAVHEDESPFPGNEHPAMITLSTGKPCFNVIMGVHRPDHSLVWIQINSRPIGGPLETKPIAVVATFADVTRLRETQAKSASLADELQQALTTALSGYLPICANCKGIRDQDANWVELERYIKERTGTDFTHTLCPGCIAELYPDIDSEND